MRTFHVVLLDGTECIVKCTHYDQFLLAFDGLFQLLSTQPCVSAYEVFGGLPDKMTNLRRYYVNTALGTLGIRNACLEAYLKDLNNV